MNAAKATAAGRPVPLSSAAAAAVIPLHLAHTEKLMAARRTRTITHHERIIPGPTLAAHLVTSAVADAEQDDKVHPAEVWIRMESGEAGPQLVIGYTQETTS